tara:strand:+ start:176 stop:910 length:735 start_codon:yes stop_codon:yes gene_type:complete
LIGVGKNQPYLDLSDIIDINTYMTFEDLINKSLVSSYAEEDFLNAVVDDGDSLMVENVDDLCEKTCAGALESTTNWGQSFINKIEPVLDFWSNYFEINDNFYSKFHCRWDFNSVEPKNKAMVGDGKTHDNIMKDFHNNESCVRIWTTTSEQKKGIYLYDWEERILHKTNGNAILFTPSDYHGSIDFTIGISIMIDPLINDPLECKNEQLNDYLQSADEWRNNKVIEYRDRGIDISKAWGVHFGE